MTAETTTEQEILQAQQDFESGEAQEKDTVKRGEPETRSKPEAKADEESKIEAQPEHKPEPKPDFVRITREQFAALEAAAQKTSALEGQISKVFGTMGDMQQIVRKLQSATPAGAEVELPADVVSEMEKDFPELAGHFKSGLERALKGIRGTGAASAAPSSDAAEKAVRAAIVAHEMEALEDTHPTWREIVGAVDSEGRADPNNEFRKWLASQDQAYQRKVNVTNSSAVIAKAIDRFKASKAAPARAQAQAPKAADRQARIQAAIQPKGDGGTPTQRNTAIDEFESGFASR